MGNVNKVILVGNVGSDPEVKKGDKGTVTIFRMATNENFKDSAGTKQERTEWHRIVTFGKLADICGEHLSKGRQVYIEGSIRSNAFTDKEGKERRTFEIVANDVKFLNNKKSESEAKEPAEEVDDTMDI